MTESENQTVTISKEEYDELISDQKFLYCLQDAGVNNWEGYEIAQDALNE